MSYYKKVQTGMKIKPIKYLTISFAIMNDFGDIGRLKCRLTGIDQHHPSLNGINQIYSIWKCKLAETKHFQFIKIADNYKQETAFIYFR